MRIEAIAIGALLISPLLLGQQFAPSAGRGQIDELLYQQAVSDHGVSAGLVTNPRGVNFRAYMAAMLTALKNNKITLDWSHHPGSLTVEATISRDGSLSKLDLPPKGFLLHPRSPFNVGVYLAVIDAVNSAKSFWPLNNLNRDDIIVDFTIAPPL